MKVFGFRFTRRVNLFFDAIHTVHSGPDNEYWSRLTHAIELAHQINENIVISGDLNSNLFNVNNNKLVIQYRRSEYCYQGAIQLLLEYQII
jgi:hypothetical protein